MEARELHVLLNHYPMIGTIIGVVLLFIGLLAKSDKVKRVSLWIFIAAALVAFPIYVTGEIAGSGMAGGLFGDLIKQHRSSALRAFALIEVTGIAAAFGLILWSRRPRAVRWIVLFVLVSSLASSVIITRTTLMGRQIKWGPTASDNKSQTDVQRVAHKK